MASPNTRPTVADIRAIKARGEKISMLYVTTPEEAAAADAAGVHMLSIEGRFMSPEMREAAGRLEFERAAHLRDQIKQLKDGGPPAPVKSGPVKYPKGPAKRGGKRK